MNKMNIMTVEEKIFNDKIDQINLEELMYDEFYDLIVEAKTIGYNKALRWRDPKEELPETGKPVLVKYRTAKNVEKYGIGRYFYLGIGNPWTIEGSTNRNVIGWRPIENKNHFEARIEEAGCDFCRDEQGYTIGNMYVCDKCGRQVP